MFLGMNVWGYIALAGVIIISVGTAFAISHIGYIVDGKRKKRREGGEGQ